MSMPIPDFRALTLAATMLLGAASPSLAFDPSKVFEPDAPARDVLRYGYEALKGGRMDDAIGAFSYGADHDNIAAEWKLARILERGEGVERDEKTARELYARIAARFGSDERPTRMEVPYLSSALVALGRYALRDGEVRSAENHFYRAAALYHDAEAQYQLGALYRSGALGVVQNRSAARWFSLAVRKGHPLAQAELGGMMFAGEGVTRRPVRGLVLLMTAAKRVRSETVRKLHDEAVANAAPDELAGAEAIVLAGTDQTGAAAQGVLPAAPGTANIIRD